VDVAAVVQFGYGGSNLSTSSYQTAFQKVTLGNTILKTTQLDNSTIIISGVQYKANIKSLL